MSFFMVCGNAFKLKIQFSDYFRSCKLPMHSRRRNVDSAQVIAQLVLN